LEAAKLSAFDTGDRYICDLLTPGAKASERQLQNLRSMEWQYRKISQRLAGKSPWQSLVTAFPELQVLASELGTDWEGAGSGGKIERPLLKLYARYVAEWGKFSARERLGTRARAA
jgi:hypothetical protein